MELSEADFQHETVFLHLCARQLGIELDEAQLAMFQRYFEMLIAWNRRLNLTRITVPRDVAIRHFLDSLTCLLVMPIDSNRSPRVIDIGSGAGFPGLPVKIARQRLRLTLLESVAKKTEFLKEVVSRLHLDDVAVIHGRAEDVGRDSAHRQAYDVSLARAVAPLATLAELCLPFLSLGGRMIALKTAAINEERQAARGAIATLGGSLVEERRVVLPGLEQPRLLVVIEKVRDTPKAYPRHAGLPSKSPLR